MSEFDELRDALGLTKTEALEHVLGVLNAEITDVEECLIDARLELLRHKATGRGRRDPSSMARVLELTKAIRQFEGERELLQGEIAKVKPELEAQKE